ncbi:MAG TPA: oligosaccharide flippase family protein, partial [Candidatus Diapherotrites archaeon]|nr:oligosaccharide flippase family protein [Candidatus Diapherotrites archaeon]
MTERTSKGFAKNVLFSYSNKVLTLVVSFLYTFLIANYLGPEKYGAITYFISFVTGLAGALGFNFLIGTVSNYFPKGKPKRLFKLLLYGILGLSFLTFLALLISAIPILAFLGKSGVSLFQLTSILILLAPSFTLFTALFQGFKRFGSVLKVVGAESILNLAFAVVAVLFLNLDVYGVIYAKIASLIIAVALFAFLSKKLVFSKKPIDRKDLKRYLITFAPFSLVRGWEGQALTVLIGLFVGNFQLGLYYMAQKLASIAIATPINSLRDVLLPYSLEKSSDLKVIGNYASLNVKLALVVSILLSIALLALGWPVLYLLFPKFIEAYWLLPFF